jgi:hypothetical protein
LADVLHVLGDRGKMDTGLDASNQHRTNKTYSTG